MIHAIAAVGRSGQIGLDNKLPWHCPEDLRWFRDRTAGNVVVVGYRTALTLPPLPGRTIRVMLRGESPKDVIDEFAGQDLWVIGGAATYRQWMPHIQRFHINVLPYHGAADTFMPPLFADRLQALLNKHGICEDCGDLYEHDYDAPFASCGCKTAEWYSYTPHMKKQWKIREALAEATAYDLRLDEKEVAPTGDDYNHLMSILREALK